MVPIGAFHPALPVPEELVTTAGGELGVGGGSKGEELAGVKGWQNPGQRHAKQKEKGQAQAARIGVRAGCCIFRSANRPHQPVR